MSYISISKYSKSVGANNHFEADGLPFRFASGQAAAQVERWATMVTAHV